MSTTYDDILYDDYLAEQAQREMEAAAIDEFRANILKRYFEKNKFILKDAKNANDEAVQLEINTHHTASVVFSFIAIELLMKEVIIKPLIHGNIIEESIADFLTADLIGKMKNYSQYSDILAKFLKVYADIDIRSYKKQNLLEKLEYIQKMRNNAIHKGHILTRAEALEANKISKLFYSIVVDMMYAMKLKVDRKNWSIIS